MNKLIRIFIQFFSIFILAGVCRADVTIGSGVTGMSHPTQASAGGAIFTQILFNPAWPGQRPKGMEARLHYPVGPGQVMPSDDQMIIDVVLNVPTGIGPILMAEIEFLTGVKVIVPRQGALDGATWPDRMYLALVMLRRSANYPLSTAFFDERYNKEDLLPYVNLYNDDFRLLNRYRISATLDNNGLPLNDSIIKQDAIIGPTPFHINQTVKISVQAWPAKPTTMSITPLGFSIYVPNDLFQGQVANPLYGNDQVLSLPPGWAAGSGGHRLAHRNASRIGPLIIDDERYILNEDGQVPIGKISLSPFWNEIVFDLVNGSYQRTALTCNQKAVVRTDWNYLANGANWPTHYIYWYDFHLHGYTLQEKRSQIPSPFNGWMKLPPGVSPPKL